MDILMSEFLPRKVEHITSSLCSSVFLWTSKLPLFPMKKISKQHLVSNYKCDILLVGLKTLAIHHHHSEEKLPPPRVVHCYTIPPTSKQSSARPLPPPPPSMWLSSSSAFQCTMIGDVLGAESGDCMMMMTTSEVVDQVEQVIVKAEPPEEPSMVQSKSMMMRDKEKDKTNKEFPPPITLLRTHMGGMPWALKRECGDDKRLIIRAERVTRHEHVEARRVNGRLTMNLVYEEDDDGEGDDDDVEYCNECGYPKTEEEVEEEAVEFDDLEFNEEPNEGLECEDEEQEEEFEEGGFEFEVEGSSLEEGKLCWDLSEGVAYGGEGGGFVHDSGSVWAGGSRLGDPNGYMGRPASASAPLRPITSVM